jgi:hypothetical protein
LIGGSCQARQSISSGHQSIVGYFNCWILLLKQISNRVQIDITPPFIHKIRCAIIDVDGHNQLMDW